MGVDIFILEMKVRMEKFRRASHKSWFLICSLKERWVSGGEEGKRNSRQINHQE